MFLCTKYLIIIYVVIRVKNLSHIARPTDARMNIIVRVDFALLYGVHGIIRLDVRRVKHLVGIARVGN